uniref:TauD/TfdA-like domain-containing protein n=1 Tax=Aplanochytrium stocchinoi TaxID=215587 RepID=A0A7S3PR62_9STRA|mmetsp:Transcript_19675/g.23873  ORF Transcript_19675/g.23873 Transcript_19675/m.23873 type:complete len:170 (+) Transcript_19675:345-854(+)
MSRARIPFICPPLREQTISVLHECGAKIRALEPFGAEVTGLNLRDPLDGVTVTTLQHEMSLRGFVCFRQQGVLTAEEQVSASKLWGGKEIHTTHSNHFASPHPDVFRLSNDPLHGIPDVGPQWHNDGSFLPRVFSHVGYHIVSVPAVVYLHLIHHLVLVNKSDGLELFL